MLFRRLILLSLFVGIIAGGVLTLAQQFQSTEIILQSEKYEIEEVAAEDTHGPGHHQQHHEETAWGPAAGIERLVYSLLANMFTAMGYSAMLLALMVYYQFTAKNPLGLAKGALSGLLGYLTFFAAPSLGLPPEIPGTQAAALESRQIWWVATVIATGFGFVLIFFKQQAYRQLFLALGVLLLVLPHLLGAPQVSGPEFIHPDPAAVETLMQLHHQFIIAVSVVNFIFWLSIGLLCAWGLGRWVFKAGTRRLSENREPTAEKPSLAKFPDQFR